MSLRRPRELVSGVLSSLSEECQTHDYRNLTRSWGHDIGYRLLEDNFLDAYGWGPRGPYPGIPGKKIREGDFILLTNGDSDTRYQVMQIRYADSVKDQWFAKLKFAPRDV